MAFLVSHFLLKKMLDGNSCSELPFGKATEIFTYFNKKYIVVGSVSSGYKGVVSVQAYECISLKTYSGKAVTYDEHRIEVMNEISERGYSNIKFKYKNVNWVIIGNSIEFLPVQENKQLNLF